MSATDKMRAEWRHAHWDAADVYRKWARDFAVVDGELYAIQRIGRREEFRLVPPSGETA